ncbi:unnamed protein product [Owenia fusiformis]|uniref:Uncharacterized protein n=1 Tax=Owenia fusiformis TaxID=6347 RepID=A0A8J1TF74_OWEFU|nr:unnamed protein product [Owenia fusiformis]
MTSKVPGQESAAIGLLSRAVQLDTAKRFTEAIVCYQEGIQLLLDVMKVTQEESKRQAMRQKVEEYMVRAEKLKTHIEEEKQSGRYHEQILIKNDSTGHSYERLISRFIDGDLTLVEVEDPYIRSNHQIYNFLRFCEVLIKAKHNHNLQRIILTTGKDGNNPNSTQAHNDQKRKLDELAANLLTYQVQLQVQYKDNLHDREIRFDNGWIIKVGRGLDYFKATNGKFVIGFCDFDLRKCHETTVDIFHKKHTNTKYDCG